MAVTARGGCLCWGDNTNSKLGLGTNRKNEEKLYIPSSVSETWDATEQVSLFVLCFRACISARACARVCMCIHTCVCVCVQILGCLSRRVCLRVPSRARVDICVIHICVEPCWCVCVDVFEMCICNALCKSVRMCPS